MSKTVTVIGKPACRDCIATEAYMKSRKVPFTKKSINDDGMMDLVQKLGYKSFPIVVVDDETHWAGFNQTKIAELAKALHVTTAAAAA